MPGQTVTNIRCGKDLRRTLNDPPRANTLRPEEIEIGKHVIDGEAAVDVRNAELHVSSGMSRVTGRDDIHIFRKLMVDLGRPCRTMKEQDGAIVSDRPRLFCQFVPDECYKNKVRDGEGVGPPCVVVAVASPVCDDSENAGRKYLRKNIKKRL